MSDVPQDCFAELDERSEAEREVERHAAGVRFWGPDNQTPAEATPPWPGAGLDENDYSPETP